MEYWQQHTNKSTSSEGLSWTARTPTITNAAAVKEISNLQQLNVSKQKAKKNIFLAQPYLQCLKKNNAERAAKSFRSKPHC